MSKLDTILGNANTSDTTEVTAVVDTMESVDESEIVTPEAKPEPEPEKSKKGRSNKSAKAAKSAESRELAEPSESAQAVDSESEKTLSTESVNDAVHTESESATDESLIENAIEPDVSKDICVPKKINLKSAIAIYQTPKACAGIGYTDGPVYVMSTMPTAAGFVRAKCLVRGVGPLQCFVSMLDLGKNKQTED